MKKTDESIQTDSKATRKYMFLYRLVWFLSGILAIAFAVVGFIELLDIDNLRFIRMGNSFQFALLFLILGMVSRIYYKVFE